MNPLTKTLPTSTDHNELIRVFNQVWQAIGASSGQSVQTVQPTVLSGGISLGSNGGNTPITIGMVNPMTKTGQIIYGGNGGNPKARDIGSDGQVLTVVDGLPVWRDATGGFTNPMTDKGDMIYAEDGGVPTRLPVGTEGQVLILTDGIPQWITVDISGWGS